MDLEIKLIIKKINKNWNASKKSSIVVYWLQIRLDQIRLKFLNHLLWL